MNTSIKALIKEAYTVEQDNRHDFFTNGLFNLHAEELITTEELDQFYNHFLVDTCKAVSAIEIVADMVTLDNGMSFGEVSMLVHDAVDKAFKDN